VTGASRTVAALLFLAAALPAQDMPPECLPPPLIGSGPSPALLFESLTPEQTRAVSGGGRVHVFAEESRKDDGTLVLRVQSLGVLDVPISEALAVFGDPDRYPEWVVLSPSYKTVRVLSGNRFRAGLGKSDRDEVKTEALYSVTTGGDAGGMWAAQWTFEEKVRAFQAGSFLDYTLQAHPTDPGRTLVLHTQETRVKGFLARRYLTGKTDSGRTRHWKDAGKHARRIHWAAAVAAAGIRDPGRAREAYARHYEREFGHLPPGYKTPR